MDRRTPFRDGPEDCSETTTAQHIIYNTHRGCLEPGRSAKTSQQKTRPGTPLPLPRPPKKKHPQTTRKRLLIKSPSPVRCPRNRFPGPSPSVNPCIGPHARIHTQNRKRLRADAVKSTHLKPSCHRTGTTTAPRPKPECDPRCHESEMHPRPTQELSTKQAGASFPHQAQCGRVPEQWARASAYWPQSGG